MSSLRSWGISLLVILGIFVVGAMLMNYVVMPMLVHQRRSVIMPELHGMSEQQARKITERLSLQFRVERSDHDIDVPEGHVITQRPRPNESIKEGRTVSVVLSMGAKTQRVPDLRGLSLRQGRLMLSRQKLRVGRVAKILSPSDNREMVLSCSPGAGREIEEGGMVDLLVSVGGQRKGYIMPNFEGQDLLFIRDKLEQSGFRVSSVRYESRKNVYPNTIIGQSPRPGAMIREGDSIELVAAGTE